MTLAINILLWLVVAALALFAAMRGRVLLIDGARNGATEFILLLPETNNKGALEMAERIRKAVELSRFSVRDGDSNVTVSLGVASYPEDGGNLDVILEKADKAMYRAKQKGRNRVVSYLEDTVG